MDRTVETEAEGKVVYFDEDDGFGFIETDDLPHRVDEDEDVFFHVSDIKPNSAEVGQRFEFVIVETDEGYRANALRRIKLFEKENDSGYTHQPSVNTSDLVEANKRKKPDRGGGNSKTKSDNKDSNSEDNNPFNEAARENRNDLL